MVGLAIVAVLAGAILFASWKSGAFDGPAPRLDPGEKPRNTVDFSTSPSSGRTSLARGERVLRVPGEDAVILLNSKDVDVRYKDEIVRHLAAVVPAGTKCRVVEGGMLSGMYKVRVLEGDELGLEAWTLREWVHRR